ncbi:MAG: transposase [Halioglobus sp.]
MPRLVVPGLPHHVTQRGARRMKTFFNSSDYLRYLDLIVEYRELAGADIWAYCLMPNHVHLVVVPQDKDSLAVLFRHVHRRYTREINVREGCTGHLWQERYHSFVMDENHLLATVRYAELNPVRAKLCDRAEDWPWSSVHAHLAEEDDAVVSVAPMLQRVSDWTAYLSQTQNNDELERIRAHGRSGRPAGDDGFVEHLQFLTGKALIRRKSGPKHRIE